MKLARGGFDRPLQGLGALGAVLPLGLGDKHREFIATEAGETTTYALLMVQERGKLFVSPG